MSALLRWTHHRGLPDVGRGHFWFVGRLILDGKRQVDCAGPTRLRVYVNGVQMVGMLGHVTWAEGWWLPDLGRMPDAPGYGPETGQAVGEETDGEAAP